MPLIVLEGLDGAGKSTQIRLFEQELEARGIPFEFLHFPRFDAPVYGNLIARFLRGEFGAIDAVDPYLVALLFAGDRADAGPMIQGWLDQGKFVLLDRFVYSNVAFQGAKFTGEKRADLARWIIDMEFGYNKLPRPDLSVFLDVPLDFIAQRLSAGRKGADRDYLQGADDIHEASLGFQQAVREVYLEYATQDPSVRVVRCADAGGAILPMEAISRRIIELASPFFKA